MNPTATRFRAHLVALAGTASMLAMPGVALAQDQAAAAGDQSASSEEGLGEIIVTAQFRSQKLQDTPLAITAMSGEMMEQRGVSNLVQVSASAPNVSMQRSYGAYGANSAQVFIRGVGQRDFYLGYEPGVAIYIDDVYYSTVFGSALNLMDIDRVEVLRGPQGTLFGKNTIGGAVRVLGAEAKGDGSGYAQISGGSDKFLSVRGAIDMPLGSEAVALRLSGGVESRDGYVDRIDFKCANPSAAVSGTLPAAKLEPGSCSVGKLGGQDVVSLRGNLRWEASPDIKVWLTADYMKDNSDAPAQSPILFDTRFIPAQTQARYQAQYGVILDNRFLTNDPYKTYASFDDPTGPFDLPTRSSLESYGLSAKVEAKLADSLTLTSITAYRRYVGRFADDSDNSPLPYTHQLFTLRHRQFSQELRLGGNALSGLVDWTLGGFYFDSRDSISGYVRLDNAAAALGGLDFQFSDPLTAENKSGFAHVVVHPTDKLNLTLGYRYTDEKKVFTFDRGTPAAGSAAAALNLAALNGTPRVSAYQRSDYKIGIDYHWTDDVMTYAQFSTGFKAGGTNPRPLSPAQATPFGPETIKAYEVGLKSELFDRKLRFNLAGFFSQYGDLQLQALGSNNVIQVINVGKVDIKGIEAEVEARPADALLINLSGSYLDFKYTSLGTAAGVAGAPCITCAAPYTPAWKLSGGIQYDISGLGGTITPRVDVNYQSSYFVEATNNSNGLIPGRTLVNARLAWEGDNGFEVAFSVSNLFDKFYYENIYERTTSSGLVYGIPTRGRQLAASVKKRF